MQTEIYSFTQDHSILILMLYGILIICGVCVVGYALLIMPKKECEFDGRTTKLKYIPVGFRVVMQGFPVLMGLACIVAGLINGSDSVKYYQGWYHGEVLTASGPVENVYVQTDEDGNADIFFSLDGNAFSLEFSSDVAEYFAEGNRLSVQYGVSGEEQLIYYINTES